LEQSLANLKRKGQIKFVQGRTGWRVELTERGQEEFLALETREKILTRPKKWDKKWRLLVFDIPEAKKKVRDRVRYALISFGFYRLQDSVWAYPYECEEVLELLRTKYGVRYEALYIRAEKIAKDQWLQKHFNLL
jgi:DNA-binding transcriptional regulator PaaX